MPPGETPPDSGSVSTGPTTPGSGGRNVAPWVLLGVGVVFVAFVALFFVGRLL